MFKNLWMFRALVLLALAGFGGGAHAGLISTSYRVVLDTSAYAGTGWLDLQFNPAFATSGAATATVGNFTGALDAGFDADVQGDVSGGLPAMVSFANGTGFNALFQAVTLGGIFSFDLAFGGDVTGMPGSVFALALYGADQFTALGSGDPFTNSLVMFELGQGVTSAISDPGMVSVTEVPEPAVLWLLLIGVAAIGVARNPHVTPAATAQWQARGPSASR